MNLLLLFQNWCSENSKPVLDNYIKILRTSLDKINPCYSEEYYFTQFNKITSNRTHFAIQQINSAIEESFGARRLIELVEELPENNYGLESKFLAHAKEEVFHFTLFINMFNNIFSDISVSPELKKDLVNCTPNFPDKIHPSSEKIPYSRVLEELVQINAGEMRNLVQLILTKPAMLNHAKSDDEKLFAEKTMNRLIADEYGHIYYTADLIEKHSKDGFYDSLQSLYIEALGLFDKEARKFMWHNDTIPIK